MTARAGDLPRVSQDKNAGLEFLRKKHPKFKLFLSCFCFSFSQYILKKKIGFQTI
jgi:hypothetical protein